MSFGVGVMDIAGVVRFSWKIYKALRDSSDDFRRLSTEVGSLHTVLMETEDCMRENPQLDPEKKRRLLILTEACQDTLNDLQRLLDNYESLGTQAQRTWDRMHWGLSDQSEIRMRLISNAATLGAFTSALNNSSITRMDKKLAKFITEVKAGLREGSVVTASDVAETIDTPGVWDQLRRELEDVGIGESVIEDNREYISAWFRQSLQEGLAGATDDGSRMSSVSSPRTLSADSGRISPTTVPLQDRLKVARLPSDSGYGGSISGSTVADMKSATEGFEDDFMRRNSSKSVEEGIRKLGMDAPTPRVVAKKKGSPGRLLLKMLQKNDAIIQAASDGDAKKVAKLIGLGVNVNTRDRWGWTALSMCGYGGHIDIARILLDHGADLDNIDVDGESPEDLARNRGNRDMVLLFEEARKVRDQKTREQDDEKPRKVEL